MIAVSGKLFAADPVSLLGTNQPGERTRFRLTISGSTTNLAFIVDGNGVAWSELGLAREGATGSDVGQWVARRRRDANQVNLESPELQPGDYWLEVRTPAESGAHAFRATLFTNRVDLRSRGYPVVKALGGSTTGVLTNEAGTGSWHYFQVDVPEGRSDFRVVVSSADTNRTPSLYVRKDRIPDGNSFEKASVGRGIRTVTITDRPRIADTYFVGVHLPATMGGPAPYELATEGVGVRELAWDPGLTHEGTQVFANASPTGGDYFFRVHPRGTATGAWRTALNVRRGEAHVYLRNGPFVDDPGGYTQGRSERVGSDGFVLHSSQFSEGQVWHACVSASAGADWELVSGEPYVLDLGGVPPVGRELVTTDVVVGAEGLRFFRATPPASTPAWRLWLHGATNDILVKKATLPLPAQSSWYELRQAGQMLLVPGYLAGGDQYLIGVPGEPGSPLRLESRQHEIVDLPFDGLTDMVVSGFGYRTFRVAVPVTEHGWSTEVVPLAGDPQLAVRRDLVPNEWNNDAVSEAVGAVKDAITLVPPALTDGTFFVTVYGEGDWSAKLASGNPLITDVPFVGSSVNDDPQRVGWRYYRVLDIAAQLGSLGWQVFLENQPPGALLALRRNHLPGRWNYRRDNRLGVGTLGYADVSDDRGILQRPGHPADVWYIGVYHPTNALGAFTLVRRDLPAPALAFDGGTASVSGLPSRNFAYWRIEVPEGVLGWDVRLTNVTEGSPRLVVRRDALPQSLDTQGWSYPEHSLRWDSGAQWGTSDDWTDLGSSASGRSEYGRILAMGMGNPLSPGTYYIGVMDPDGNPRSSFTLASRGIGPGLALPVRPLDFSGGSVRVTGLPAREAAYFRIDVPTNRESWKLRLSADSGESSFAIQKDALPNVKASDNDPWSIRGGRWMRKSGTEEYLMLPYGTSPHVTAGTYYLAAISEGQDPDPARGRVGAGAIDAILTSFGSLDPLDLGVLSDVGLDRSGALAGGETTAYRFSVPPGTQAFEVWLETLAGHPDFVVRESAAIPGSSFGYGIDGGPGGARTPRSVGNQAWVTVANPVSGTWTIQVQAGRAPGSASVHPDARFKVRVLARTATPLPFDGGSVEVDAGHRSGTWRYFGVTVPTNALGWDLRLNRLRGGVPRLVVRRGSVPERLTTSWAYAGIATSWPVDQQWAPDLDWTLQFQDFNGTNRSGHVFQAGMGNPLEPGDYFVGITDTEGQPAGLDEMRYTLVSRGIGPGMAIPVVPLAFGDGVARVEDLAPREAAYFSVEVPTNAPAWRLRLASGEGETVLLTQRGALPNIAVGRPGIPPRTDYSQARFSKVGDETYLQIPTERRSDVVAGTYYVMAASLGRSPSGSRLGERPVSFSLTSSGVLPVTELGRVLPGSEIRAPDVLDGATAKAYRFDVPEGTLGLVIQLEDVVGSPRMSLSPGLAFPTMAFDPRVEGGHPARWTGDREFRTSNPSPGVHTLLLFAGSFAGSQVYSNASYALRVRAEGALAVPFDGGRVTVNQQEPGAWTFLHVTNVPPDALGWEVRLRDVTSGAPGLVIQRDTLPSELSSNPGSMGLRTTWNPGESWAASLDWTGAPYAADGRTDESGRTLQMGMGNPLQTGSYYLGVRRRSLLDGTPASYTLTTRGIGDGYSIPVVQLSFAGGNAERAALGVREADYYRVDVPVGARSWKVRLAVGDGDSLLLVQKDRLPNVEASDRGSLFGPATATALRGGFRVQKPGTEHYVLLPEAGRETIPDGRYYLIVASEGMAAQSGRVGTNSSSYRIESVGELPVRDLGAISGDGVTLRDAVEGGDLKAYRFSFPSDFPPAEIRLSERVGRPIMSLRRGTAIPVPSQSSPQPYGYDRGAPVERLDERLLVMPDAGGTNYTLVIAGGFLWDPVRAFNDSTYTLKIGPAEAQNLAFDPVLEGCPGSNCTNAVRCGTLAQGDRIFYRVVVPEMLPDGSDVLGWRLALSNRVGNAQFRIRQGQLPGDFASGQTSWVEQQAVLAPPQLVSGVWYVEVMGAGPSEFCLSSSAIRLERPAWAMPPAGETVLATGSSAAFGDTGIGPGGAALPGDGGIDLAQGAFHYYAVTVPPGNGGLLRTMVEAIQGNPNLYVRAGGIPTLTHGRHGLDQLFPYAYDRSLTGTGTEYGNWVVDQGRTSRELTNGVWYLAIQSAGASHCRYRLRVSTGNVLDLPLEGGVEDQRLAAGDWRYYRLWIPTNAPLDWSFSFQQVAGDVWAYLRDSIPPGQLGQIHEYRDWSTDRKNGVGSLPQFSFDRPDTYRFPTPPLRPGQPYYLGFRAVTDATFRVSSSPGTRRIEVAKVLSFRDGRFAGVLAPGERTVLRVDVPPDATRWVSTSKHSEAVRWALDQGTLPEIGLAPLSSSRTNQGVNQYLLQPNGWPWVPGQMYFLVVTNATSVPQPFDWIMDGRDCDTDDDDRDGLLDCWEHRHFGATGTGYSGASDPDGDGNDNATEYQDGTDPMDPRSMLVRLRASAVGGGTVVVSPDRPSHPYGTRVVALGKPDAGRMFLGWGGLASGGSNPTDLVLSTNGVLTAWFGPDLGACGTLLAEYDLQTGLSGRPTGVLDLKVDGREWSFSSGVVDGFARPSLRLAGGSGLVLQPASSVMTSNAYSIVLLFKADQVNGMRRFMDLDLGRGSSALYLNEGRWDLYPSGTRSDVCVTNGTWHQLVVTRAPEGRVAIYSDGVQRLAYDDARTGHFSFTSADAVRIFKSVGGPELSGDIARLRIYHCALTEEEAVGLDRIPAGPTIMGFSEVGLDPDGRMVFRLDGPPGPTYRIEHSRTLQTWETWLEIRDFPGSLRLTNENPLAPYFLRALRP